MSEAAFDDKELAVIEKVCKLLNLARDKGEDIGLDRQVKHTE